MNTHIPRIYYHMHSRIHEYIHTYEYLFFGDCMVHGVLSAERVSGEVFAFCFLFFEFLLVVAARMVVLEYRVEGLNMAEARQ